MKWNLPAEFDKEKSFFQTINFVSYYLGLASISWITISWTKNKVLRSILILTILVYLTVILFHIMHYPYHSELKILLYLAAILSFLILMLKPIREKKMNVMDMLMMLQILILIPLVFSFSGSSAFLIINSLFLVPLLAIASGYKLYELKRD